MQTSDRPLRVLVVGLGTMGRSHALAYEASPGFAIAGLVNRSPVRLPPPLDRYAVEHDLRAALDRLRPDVVSIATHPDSHAGIALAALEAGAHVFVEKPLAATLADAEAVVAAAGRAGRKLVVGYILRHHPAWIRLIEEARALGGPWVFRLNLNQRSTGDSWAVHRRLMESVSPLVDCGVHYVDVMCQITDSEPVEVRGMGVRLTEEIAPDMYNYGHFQVLFADGSAGWYEAGWGPMMSETAFFVKDVISPGGAVSIRGDESGASDDHAVHVSTSALRRHRTGRPPELLAAGDEPDHQGLCDREAAFVARAIREDLDLSRHLRDALRSLAVCLAADESVRTGQPVRLA